MSQLTLALVTLDYPPEKGGVARYLGNLVSVSQGKIDVFVNETHMASGPGRVEVVPLVQNHGIRWWPMIGFFRSLRTRGYAQTLVSHVLPVGTAAYLASWFGGPRYSVLLHGLDLRLALGSKRKTWLARRILRRAKQVFVNSLFVANEVRLFDPCLSPVVVTPGVEPLSFPDRIATRQAFGLSSDCFTLLCVTRLVPRKGIDILIKSLNHLSHAVDLVVIGDGSDFARLSELAKPFGQRIKFLRKVNDEERNQWYAAADCFVMPARDEGSDVEGFGIVYLEAAFAGLPVIAGRTGGVPEAVIHEETGLLVNPDEHDVAKAIQSLMNDSDLRQQYGQAGKRRVQKEFRWVDRWEMYRKILSL